jgi:protein-disulfide isomerase
MTRRLTLTTGIALVTLSLLYLRVSAYTTGAPHKVDALGDLHAPTLGQADALESMIVFTDYRCPHCRAFENTVMPKLERRVDQGALSLTVVPIGMLGDDSKLTAKGALCAARQGETRFSAFHKAMFDMPGVNQAGLIELAEKQGLARNRFITCLEEDLAAQEVEENTRRARETGIRGTPTVVVGGLAYANPSWDQLQGTVSEGR